MSERVSGGFGSAYFSEPVIIDLRTIPNSIINAAGYNGLSYYMDETYNKKNNSYIRKMYCLKDIQLN